MCELITLCYILDKDVLNCIITQSISHILNTASNLHNIINIINIINSYELDTDQDYSCQCASNYST